MFDLTLMSLSRFIKSAFAGSEDLINAIREVRDRLPAPEKILSNYGKQPFFPAINSVWYNSDT